MKDKGLILVVDDVSQNLQVLRSTLQKEGYRIAAANNGHVALRFLQKELPDLILLDVMMPELNGFEVCQQIKADPTTREIPVIFLTARTEAEDVLAGFEAGGVDYITKPFNMAELLMRVKTHLELKHARDTIMGYNKELELLNREKSEFLGIASHDLRNPLTVILMHAQTLAADAELPPSAQESGQAILQSGRRMLDIVSNLLDINRMEDGRLNVSRELFDLQDLLSDLMRDHELRAQRKEISVKREFPDDLLLFYTDGQLFGQLLDNIVSNAIKYGPPGSTVTLGADTTPEHITLWIRDQGPGFSAADKAKMYQKFSRLSARPTAGEHSTGLGLSIAKKLAELLEITLTCESEPGAGATFYLRMARDQGMLPLLE